MICGPTATGKTGLAIRLAGRFAGEIVSADSMQIYRGLPVGTAQPTAQERAAAPHHLIDFLLPEQPYSVAEYQQQAAACIADVAARGRQPFVVGGTGLYLSSLLSGLRFAPQPGSGAVRAALEEEWRQRGAQAMYDELQRLDPEAAAATHPNNRVRVLRGLEMYRLSGGVTPSEQRARARQGESPYEALCLGLTCPDRARLYERIEQRVDAMLRDGLLEEARMVYENRARYKTAAQAIGYKEFFAYFAGEAPLEECTARLKQATRNYAKRQLTWFRRMQGVRWLDADDPRAGQTAAEMTAAFLGKESP